MTKASTNLFDFDKVATQYDNLRQGEWEKRIDILEKNLIGLSFNEFSNKNILEIGCGTGHWTDFFAKNGFKIKGIDLSKEMIAVAESKNIENTEFQLADVYNLPFEDESVENIVTFATLEFIKNKDKAIKEMHRVLKKNGTLLIGTSNKNSHWYQDNKKEEIYSSANFFDYDSLYKAMSNFGSPTIQSCLYIENDQLLDEDPKYNGDKEKGGFFVGLVHKIFL